MQTDAPSFDAQSYRILTPDIQEYQSWMEKVRAASVEIREHFSPFLSMEPVRYFLATCDNYLNVPYPNDPPGYNNSLDEVAACLNGDRERVE